MGDWTDRLRQETTTRTLAEVEAPDAGLICTENEVLFLNANGLQRAPLSEITKVSRDGPDLVLAGGAQTFVRGAIGADKLSLANFFAEVKQAVAQARTARSHRRILCWRSGDQPGRRVPRLQLLPAHLRSVPGRGIAITRGEPRPWP